jgi:soluble lytic murein transglycosylase-like protein
MQHQFHIVNTFGSFTGALHPNIGDRVEMSSGISEFIALVYVVQERKDMKNSLSAGLVAGAILCLASAIPAEAGCRDSGTCTNTTSQKSGKATAARHKTAYTTKSSRGSKATRHHRSGKARAVKSSRRHVASASRHEPAAAGRVVSLISAMAPAQGVPTWFALRIAKVESNYNPSLRGAAGEYGVFQLKCATAKGIGFSGNCSALLDPSVNVRYGLKHLALAMKSSRGNLRLAASKHNGGLGRKTEVRGYVAKIF